MKKFINSVLISSFLFGSCAYANSNRMLLTASANSDLENVTRAIREGADVNVENPLIPGLTPLRYAITNNNIQIVQKLLKNNADLNYWSSLELARAKGHKEIVTLIKKHRREQLKKMFTRITFVVAAVTYAWFNGNLEGVKNEIRQVPKKYALPFMKMVSKNIAQIRERLASFNWEFGKTGK